ncbi:16S rRNA (cytosine(1402)-N(4))-methyltransferase RsmH [Microvirga thermotolerans]|uniref:Ribosomal RNA small subunit methyltransferase H n=1 Tax=Microvirga thermotolerans TaxID=2651334 RepID=A0A5P9JZS4_9HYPH|nr:16S rRNA (cytosine(1402)-N(4))-methyltransferase RsmH [Microvirga thermotolerans]QFU17136.1 16S rRNA (cytosine(1402)-N(4))-methyltransferase RsmH [Microvirga thermotolerans]
MMGRGDGPGAGAAGGPTRHVPVLLEEVCEALDARRGGAYVDGTFGAGGYTRAILDANPKNGVLAIDRDPDAIAGGAALVSRFKRRLTLVQGRFGQLDEIVRAEGLETVDGVVLDIGVSSMQLDEAERGFSFRSDGPLDMRMEREGPSAADLVNEASEAELADIFYHYGEERRARAVARAIVEARRRQVFRTTGQLAELVASLIRQEPGGIHPATRVFQGLRIAVNDELGELVRALHAAERILKPGGRLVVVTFHSLEDRIVKQFFAARTGRSPSASRHLPGLAAPAPTFEAVTRGPVLPGEDEIARNPRARSSKLRAGSRTGMPPQAPLSAITMLAELPQTADKRGGRR